MKADSARDLFVDEVDEFDLDIEGQGNIYGLADARHGSYTDGQTGGVSTPTQGRVETYRHPLTGLVNWDKADKDQLGSQVCVCGNREAATNGRGRVRTAANISFPAAICSGTRKARPRWRRPKGTVELPSPRMPN